MVVQWVNSMGKKQWLLVAIKIGEAQRSVIDYL